MVSTDINLTPTATLYEIEPHSVNANTYADHRLGKILARSWGTPSECQAAVLLIHGLGAHSGWFEGLARRLKIRKLLVLAYDLVGFGKRISERYISFDQWLVDLTIVFAHLQDLMGNKPIYLIGNSMGAILALKGCSLISPAGLIMLSPGFEGYPETFRLPYRIKSILQAVVRPNDELQLPYDLKLVTNQPSVLNWLNGDPDRRFNVPGKMLIDLLKMTWALRLQNLAITCPALMLTAGQDTLVDNRINQLVFERLKSPAKKTRSFETSMHDLTLDPAIDEVAAEIVSWIMTNSANEASLSG